MNPKEGFRYFEHDEIEEILNHEFRAKIKHPLSRNLPINPYNHSRDNKIYVEKEGFYNKTLMEDVREGMASGVFDYKDLTSSIGWRVHLNVRPEDVRWVSNYLKEGRFVHKYGGNLELGKVFTLYIGSFKKTHELSQRLALDLGEALSRPAEEIMEREFSRGVVGRFAVHPDFDNRFLKYGTCGFSLLKEDIPSIVRLKSRFRENLEFTDKNRERQYEAERSAFTFLYAKYDDYFFPV